MADSARANSAMRPTTGTNLPEDWSRPSTMTQFCSNLSFDGNTAVGLSRTSPALEPQVSSNSAFASKLESAIM